MGDAEFVERVLYEMDDLSKENLRVRTKRMGLPSLAKRVFDVEGVSIGALRFGSRNCSVSWGNDFMYHQGYFIRKMA